jgi:hypothetical protein
MINNEMKRLLSENDNVATASQSVVISDREKANMLEEVPQGEKETGIRPCSLPWMASGNDILATNDVNTH